MEKDIPIYPNIKSVWEEDTTLILKTRVRTERENKYYLIYVHMQHTFENGVDYSEDLIEFTKQFNTEVYDQKYLTQITPTNSFMVLDENQRDETYRILKERLNHLSK